MGEVLEYVKGQKDTRYKIRESLVDLNKQSLVSRAKKAEELVVNQVAYMEAMKIMADDIFDLDIENKTLRDRIGEVDEKWLHESKEKMKLSFSDERKNKLILDRMKRQMQKARALGQ
jgi:hypothetical protein